MADIIKPPTQIKAVDSTRQADFLIKEEHRAKTAKRKHKDAEILKELDAKIEHFEKEEIEVFGKEDAKPKKKAGLKTFFWLILFMILIGAGVYAAVAFLPRADIKIIAEKSEWRYNDSVTAAKNINAVSLNDKKIPAEVFSQTRNNNLLFLASGEKYIERKAGGKIIIYNAYSSDKQTLVANTRFSTPDGKIFRLVDKIVIPGAKIIEGKITPSSIEAAVVADKAGEEYNIGPMDYLSIPGFRDSPKYKGFYAESKEPMTGGFIGEMAVPTDEDIKKAKEKNRQILQQTLSSFVLSQIPDGFKNLEGSEEFKILKETVNEKTDDAGNFSVFSEANFSIIAFHEEDVKNLMTELAKKELGSELDVKEYRLEYGASRTDFNNGTMSFPINYEGVFWQPLNIVEFKESVKNKKEAELRAMVFVLPRVEKATVSFWPFWVKKAPADVKRIKVAVE